MGFEVNLCDGCTANEVVNREQLMVTWHVNNMKANHLEDEVSLEFVDCLHSVCNDEDISATKIKQWTMT